MINRRQCNVANVVPSQQTITRVSSNHEAISSVVEYRGKQGKCIPRNVDPRESNKTLRTYALKCADALRQSGETDSGGDTYNVMSVRVSHLVRIQPPHHHVFLVTILVH